MMNLNSEIDVSQFFKWWGTQLSSFLPTTYRDALTSGKGLLVVEKKSDVFNIRYVNQKQDVLLGEYESNALSTEEIQKLIEEDARYKDADIVLRIPEHLTIKQDIFLPIAAEANLRQAITYELDRYTPFNKDQVYFDFIKGEKKKNSTHIHAILIVVKKTTLDEMYDACLSSGLTPHFSDSVAQPVVSGEKSSRYNLLPSELCQKANKIPLFIMLGSLFVTLLLFAVLLFYPLYSLDTGIDKLKHHKRLVEKIALEIEGSKKGIDYLYQATQKVIDKKNEFPSMIEAINTATRVLKDDTWVSQLRYVRKNLQLTGQSSSASSLISSLEKTKIFHNAKFISPVTKDNRTGMERFKISTEVTRKTTNAEAE